MKHVLPFPEDVLKQHLAALGKTGSGKSSVMRKIVEHLLDRHEPVCIIDPKGDWWGLKSSADGKSAGYPVVIFGGDHADVPINAHSGAHVAELIATGNRPCIIDLGGWMVGERTRFFIDFASTLFKYTRGHRWLVIDECHNFVPQMKTIKNVDTNLMLHWGNRLASEGRGKGLTIIAASQRPQKVHKDFLTSCETLIAMRVIHPLDRAAVRDWIDGCADPAIGKEVLTSLASMKRGEGWMWSPEIDFGPKKISFPLFTTYDSFKPQSVAAGKLKGWAEVDLEDVKEKLSAVIEEAEANDPEFLRAEVSRLERELATTQKKLEQEQKRVQAPVVPAFTKEDRALLVDVGQRIQKLLASGEQIMGRNGNNEISIKSLADRQIPKMTGKNRVNMGKTSGSENLQKGEAAVLTVCIQFHDGATREQLTVMTGYKRSTRDAYIQRLREKGYVAIHGDLIVSTNIGRQALPNIQPLPTGKALQDYWMQRLPEGERVMLSILIAGYPSSMERSKFDELTTYKRSTRDAYLQRLSTKLLITETRGEVRASDILF